MKCKFNPIEKANIIQKKVEVSQAGWPSSLRRQTQEIPQSRILVHECVRGFESISCQKTFWTRWGRAFSWQILSYWKVNSRWQCKAKENKKSQRSLWLIPEQFQSAQKGGYPAETLETRMYAWVGTQIFTNGQHTPFTRLNLWNAN